MSEAYGPHEGDAGAEQRFFQGAESDRAAQRAAQKRIDETTSAVPDSELDGTQAEVSNAEEAADAVRREIARQPITAKERKAMTRQRMQDRIFDSH